MKKNYLVLSLALSALLFAGCNKQEVAPQGDGTIAVNITATMEDLTKTSISYDSENSQYIPSWEAGDQLSVYTATAGTTDGTTKDSDKAFTVGTITSGVAAGFSGAIADPGKDVTYDFYAAYPKSDQGNDKYSYHKVCIPSEQFPTLTSFDPAADVLAGIPVKNIDISNGTTSKDLQFSFVRKTAVLKVIPSYDGTSLSGVGSTAKIKSIMIDFGGENYVTNRVRWDLSKPNEDLNFYSSTNKSTFVSAIYLTDKPALNGGAVYLSIAPRAISSATIKVTITTDDNYVLTKSFSSMTKTLTAGNVTPITFAVNSTWTSSAPSKKTISEISGLTDNTVFTDNWYIEGIVLNAEKGSCDASKRVVAIQDNTTSGSGIVIYMNNSDNNTFSQGDKVRCYLAGSRLSVYKGLVEIVPVYDTKVSKTGTGSMYSATTINAEDINDYQSMYVSIAGAQMTDGSSSKTLSNEATVTIGMSTVGNSFNLFVPYGVAALNGKVVPTGNGTLSGIASVGNYISQIIPMAESDFSALTGTRIVTFGDAAFAGTMKAGVALSGCSISVPLNNLSADTDYKVSITPSGAGSAGINSITDQVITATTTDKKITASVTGTPTTEGDVLFTVVIKDATGANTLVTKTLKAIVANANEKMITINFADAASYPVGFPTAKGTKTGTYTFGDYSYTFTSTNSDGFTKNTGYLMLRNDGTISLPAIEEFKLTTVVLGNSSGCSDKVKVGIYTSNDISTQVTGGTPLTWSTKGSTYTYNLSGTSVNTSYFIGSQTANCQIINMTLTYTK